MKDTLPIIYHYDKDNKAQAAPGSWQSAASCKLQGQNLAPRTPNRSRQQTLRCKPHYQNLVPRTPNLAPQGASVVTTKKICAICVICGYIHLLT